MTPDIPDMRGIVGTHDIVLVTLDTLRYDVAQAEFQAGRLPHLAQHLDAAGWELRHTPGSFTYAAHCAFFAGFLPTPAMPGPHARLFCLAFPGSETTYAHSAVFDGSDNIVAGLAQRGYHTLCIGGTGFFNKQTPLGSQLPDLFAESHWQHAFGVTDADSTTHQVHLAGARLQAAELREQRVFLFLNVAAIHQPNRHYLPGAQADNLHSHAAALRYVDAALAPLWTALAQRGPAFVIVCSDHGTAYGEDGYHGHRHAHACVMQVPYAQFRIAAHD
jgi:Sulfatase